MIIDRRLRRPYLPCFWWVQMRDDPHEKHRCATQPTLVRMLFRHPNTLCHVAQKTPWSGSLFVFLNKRMGAEEPHGFHQDRTPQGVSIYSPRKEVHG